MARTRDPAIDAAVLAATRGLLETEGFAALTIDAVAARAGVGKPTVYRRWSSKAELVLATLEDAARIGRGSPGGRTAVAPDTGTLHGDLLELVDRLVVGFIEMGRTGLVGGVAAEMATNPVFAHQAQAEWLGRDEHTLAVVFDRAVERGELEAAANGAEVLAIVAGAVFYRQVILHQECPKRWRRLLVDVVTGRAGTGPGQPAATKGSRPSRARTSGRRNGGSVGGG